MTSVIVDGNYLFHSEHAVYSAYNKSGKFSTEGDEITFIQGVANKLFYALGHLPKGGKIVFCTDSKSWRKSVDIPGGGYKESRDNEDGSKGQMDKDTKEKFYRLMNEFTAALNSVGIITSRIPGAEGDDLIFMWTEYFFNKGENCVVITGDKDMTQTLRMSPGETHEPWVIQWNNKSKQEKIYAPVGWQQGWLEKPSSIFDMGVGDDRLVIKQFVNNFAVTVVPVQPHEVVVGKILLGDDGDDVPPAWSYMGKTKEGKDKIVNLSEGVAAKVISAVMERHGIDRVGILDKFERDDDLFLSDMSGIILRVMKAVDGTEERKAVVTALKRNRTLVHLHRDTLPGNLQAAIEDHIESSMDGLRTQRQKWNRKGIFEGTRFAENAAPKRDDPFAFFTVPE